VVIDSGGSLHNLCLSAPVDSLESTSVDTPKDLKTCLAAKFIASPSRHCAAAFCLQVPKLCTDLGRTLLYIFILRAYTEFVWKNEIPALGICLPQTCSSATGLPRQDHVYSTTDELFHFHNKQFDEMRWTLDSTENSRSFKKYPAPP